MDNTSAIQEIRDRIQKDLDRAKVRYEDEFIADTRIVVGGRILGLESALRTIDTYREDK